MECPPVQYVGGLPRLRVDAKDRGRPGHAATVVADEKSSARSTGGPVRAVLDRDSLARAVGSHKGEAAISLHGLLPSGIATGSPNTVPEILGEHHNVGELHGRQVDTQG
jgi:hypothetical protein